MTIKEIIQSLLDQAQDRDSLDNGEGGIFANDAQALRAAAVLLNQMRDGDAPKQPENGKPRFLTAAELEAMPFGHGWMDDWTICEADDGSEEDDFSLLRVGWADGTFAFKDSYSDLDRMIKRYNRRGGCRIWVGDVPPTDEQRKAVSWE